MRSIHRTALAALVVALALSAIGTSAALAAPEWYSSTTKPAPEWWQGGAKLSAAAATKSKGKVRLEDREGPIAVECESSGEGTVGPGAVDKQTSWTLSGCVPTAKGFNKKGEEVANLCESVKATGTKIVDLPWHSELAISGGSLRDALSAEGAGVPGFQIECKTPLGPIADKCTPTTSQISVPVSNVAAGVDASFYREGFYKCAAGGTEGVMETTQLIEAATGGKLETHIVAGTYSKLTSSVSVKDTGTVTIEDKGFSSMGIACQMEYVGTAGSGGKGTITNGFASNCLPTGLCSSVTRVEAIGYPWVTELAESEGIIRDKIVSGVETPGWKFTCSTVGGSFTDICNMTVGPQLVNGLEGNVFARFGEAVTFCKDGGSENDGVVKGELTIAPASGAIEVK
jgi:hypothetical protein